MGQLESAIRFQTREASMVVTLKNELPEIQRLVTAIEEYAEKHELPPRIAHVFTLALDELITNIISYGYDAPSEHWISVRFQKNDSDLTVVLEDDARPFNPLDRPPPDTTVPIEERSVGGLGIHFVRELMDHVEYRQENGHNILIMRKGIV